MKVRLAALARKLFPPASPAVAVWLQMMGHREVFRGEAAAFLSVVVAHAARSSAMQFQDLWVLHELGEKRGGFFVEFGAADGLDLSNTLLLERDYGWTGILAEANPAYVVALKQNRPAARISTRCLWSRSGETIAFAQTRNPLFSAVVSVASSDLDRRKRMKSRRIEVETISLNDLLTQHEAPAEIDFMSVDVEGAELEVLRAFDFDRWRVRLFSVEHNHRAEAEIDALMQQRGYERRLPQFSMHDAWYRLSP